MEYPQATHLEAFHYSEERFNVRKCHPDFSAAILAKNHAAITRHCEYQDIL